MQNMPETIGGFTQVEYLTVFITIIFGVVATEFFSGWGNMLRNRREFNIYPLHFIWTIFSFMTLIQNWYGIWPRVAFINHSFFFFFYSLVPMFSFYLMSVILFPKFKGEDVDYKKHYLNNNRTFFVVYSVYFAITILSSFVYEDRGDVVSQNLLRIGALVFSMACAYFHKKVILQYIFLGLCCAGLLQFIFVLPK